MQTFFYSRKTFCCDNGCVFYRCPKRCVSQLQSLSVFEDMVDLSEAMDYTRPMTNIPRSGDIMLLFAASWEDLEELIAMQDRFEGLKVILITDIRTRKHSEHKYHQLQPRYIAAMDTINMDGLGEVVTRMKANGSLATA